ncbi:unnamed protein product [Effrenium voratum]|uniref:Ubiquitin-like domain-containing protein n=1 Tax=Effrenium voratum TaxID=2562239 RepID=A0AA36MM10_9DINO|nr:unnamed protein product [Effrenium voratum]
MAEMHVVVSTQTVGDDASEPFFRGPWQGWRQDWDGEIGFRFRAEATFLITSLGRFVAEESLAEDAEVTLWAAKTQKKLGSVTVGPKSATVDGYAYSEVFPRIVARLGQEYCLTQTCRRGMRDPWPDHCAEPAELQEKALAFARFLGGVYDFHGGFPAFQDMDEGRRAGMLNFKAMPGIATIPIQPSMTVYGLKQELEAVTGVPPIQQELSWRMKPLSGDVLLTSEGVASGDLLVLAVRAGSLAVTASRDGTARLWSMETGQCVRQLSGHRGHLLHAEFAPSGSSVVTASQDSTARLWVVETGQCSAVLEGHTAPVVSACFAPSGASVVTASQDHTARVWTIDGTCSFVLAKHAGAVLSARFSPDGSKIATGSTDCTLRLWDPTFGEPLLQVKDHGGGVFLAEVSPDGTQLLTAAIDTQGVVLRDAASGAVLQKLADGRLAHDAAFSPDGCYILTASCDWSARLWTSSGQMVQELQHVAQVLRCRFSADGSLALTLCANHAALVWRVPDGELVQSFSGHSGPVTCGSFSPDGLQLITGSEDCHARVWDVASGRCTAVLAGHEARLEAVRISP